MITVSVSLLAMSENRSDLHIGSTISRLELEGMPTPWRLVVHWHLDRGQLVPAGVEMRCYGVDGDDETDFFGGQEHPQHSAPLLDDGEQTRAASSDLVGKRIKWGPVLGEHAARLSRMLAESATETEGWHSGSAQFMREASALAGSLTRATDDTYRLVAALYKEALKGEHRSQPAKYVLHRLIEVYRYPLDPENESHRVKVRQWIGEARKRNYLPKTTANTTRKARK